MLNSRVRQDERDEVLMEVQILRKSAHPNIIGLLGAWSHKSNELVVSSFVVDIDIVVLTGIR